MRRIARFCVTAGVPIVAVACAGRRPVGTEPTPEPRHRPPRLVRAAVPAPNPKLPRVPKVNGDLAITVVYPTENSLITSRDSNFIFGSIGNGEAGLMINGTPVPVWPNGAFLGWLPNPSPTAQYYDLLAFTSSDTVRLRYPIRTQSAQLTPPPARRDTILPVQPAAYAVLRDDSLDRAVNDTDNVVIGRPTPTGTYKWFLFPGTPVRVTGYLNERARVQLDDNQEIWVDRRDVNVRRVSEPKSKPSRGKTKKAPSLKGRAASARASISGTVLGAPQIVVHPEFVDIRVASALPPAYLVEEGDRTITITLYAPTGKIRPPTVDDNFLKSLQVASVDGRTTYRLDLSRPVFGYLAMYDRGVVTFRIRRPPTVDASHPLRGLTIAVDPGHPPIGATGPTGLYEPVPTLAVGFRVRDLLIANGAHVVMTRTDPGPVALGDRPIIARRANADALVSIHLNALPDGMNPFKNNGTGTYYFQPHSKSLATLVQQSLVPQLGLRDLGVFHENLALARPTWMPAVLAEGVFIILPDQEAAIRTPEYQDAYARGLVTGLERFFATFAQ